MMNRSNCYHLDTKIGQTMWPKRKQLKARQHDLPSFPTNRQTDILGACTHVVREA